MHGLDAGNRNRSLVLVTNTRVENTVDHESQSYDRGSHTFALMAGLAEISFGCVRPD